MFFPIFKIFEALLELESGKKFKCMWTDNGREQASDEFDALCQLEGIKRQFIVAHTPQQNGVDEQNLVEENKSNFDDSRSSQVILAEAVNTACYLINWSPWFETTINVWIGKPADYARL